MSHAQRLRQRDIRDACLLLGEATELGSDPSAWRRHVLLRLCELTGARVGLSLELNNMLPHRPPVPIDPIDVGFGGMDERTSYIRYLKSNDRAVDPSTVALCNLPRHKRFFTLRRHELVDDATWYASPIVSESRRVSNVNPFVCSMYRLNGAGSTTGFVLYKNWSEPEFSERSSRLARYFHMLLLKKVLRSSTAGVGLATRLPPHLRELLQALLGGDATKQIADALGLSQHTVKSYCKDLYARLGVHSRGELFVRLYKNPGERPILLPAGLAY